MRTIHAIFEDGVFRPTEAVKLPDHCEVEFEPRVIQTQPSEQTSSNVYAILAERYESGKDDVAKRHNEHQP